MKLDISECHRGRSRDDRREELHELDEQDSLCRRVGNLRGRMRIPTTDAHGTGLSDDCAGDGVSNEFVGEAGRCEEATTTFLTRVQ